MKEIIYHFYLKLDNTDYGQSIFDLKEIECVIDFNESLTDIYLKSGRVVRVKSSANKILEKMSER